MDNNMFKFALWSGIGILMLAIFIYWQNNGITVTKSEYMNAKIPKDFHDYTIVQVSDLHNKRFGKNQSKLLSKLDSLSPDMIVVTGDLIDRRKFDLDVATEFISGALQIAPVYYVPGNHEAWSGEYAAIREALEDAGVTVLDNTKVTLTQGDGSMSILGVNDPAFLTPSYSAKPLDTSYMMEQLKEWCDSDDFKILLSHRPELLDLYARNNMDLIFTGHAHGGQIRLPFIGGILAPDQGLLPKYTSGRHVKDSSTMFVSRGLGNSIFPIRIGNLPEIVVVTLNAEQN